MPTSTFKVTSTNATMMCNELRKNLIVWAQNQATGYRTQAAIGHTAKHHGLMTAKADAMTFVATYLQGMEIKE